MAAIRKDVQVYVTADGEAPYLEREMRKRSEPYHKFLIEDLRDPAEAAGYLNAVLETGNREAFLSALREVAEAQGGLLKLSRRTKLHRQSLYRILSKGGNPEIQSLENVLGALGLQLFVGVKKDRDLRRAA